jgi:hypothetical protein
MGDRCADHCGKFHIVSVACGYRSIRMPLIPVGNLRDNRYSAHHTAGRHQGRRQNMLDPVANGELRHPPRPLVGAQHRAAVAAAGKFQPIHFFYVRCDDGQVVVL